jgi:ATP-dependent Lon protease
MSSYKSEKKSDKKTIRDLKSKLRNQKKNKDSSSESDGETIGSSDSSHSEEEDEVSDSYETISETETDSDSSYRPPTKRRGSRKTSRNSSESDDEDNDMTQEKVRKEISKILPSKYINEKVKRDNERKREKSEKPSNNKKSVSDSSYSSKTKKSNKHRQSRIESEEDSENDDYDEEEYDDETKPVVKMDGKNINIIFGIGGDEEYDDEEDESEEFIEDDENEECDSDDEKTFMKETYIQPKYDEDIKVTDVDASALVSVPEKNVSQSKSSTDNVSKHKKSSKKSQQEQEEEEQELDSNCVIEYTELADMRRYLSERLEKNPKSKSLLKSLNECKDNIKKLVKKSRGKNAKKYHKLIHSQTQKFTNEIDYFKTKMSNKEQLSAMHDLNEINNHIQIDKPYRIALLESQIPIKYKATVMQKLNILKGISPGEPEYYKIKNWVDTFMRIPFGKYKELKVNINDGIDKCHDFMENAMKILDECVYGLNDAKMQILQMVGQWISNPEAMGTAIAIKGPMGTGKTTLIKDGISKILGREFAFIALGGAGDSSFLEGHSYTYEGSTWGKIVQILIDSKCMNPVIYFDELDKISDTPRGEEIIGILTHLTDTTQNNQFHDKYFSEVDFDLSKCLFIFSYNDESKVNPILRDRMYRIQTKGYSPKEKLTISRNYLLPKIIEQVNFKVGDIIISDDIIDYLVTNSGFTKSEDGVRNLKRCLEIIYTKLNLFRLIKPNNTLFSKEMDIKVEFPMKVSRTDVQKLIKAEENQMNSILSSMYI